MADLALNRYSIIVAGGRGNRMKTVIAKQFLPLMDKPILSHTIEKFLGIPQKKVIAVLPAKDMSFWMEIVQSSEILTKAIEMGRLQTVEGGATRYQSVANGLQAIEDHEGLVAIHDGVRPLVPAHLIEKSFEEAAEKGSAVLTIPMRDSARISENNKTQMLDRTKIRLIQTPQTFQLAEIKQAFALGEQDFFTDDSSVYEYAGFKINLIEGDPRNIKITTPEDLQVAEALFQYEEGN